jgi:hypothetical protein
VLKFAFVLQMAALEGRDPQADSDRQETAMETVWDWLTIFLFAGLVTLLLQRSSEEKPKDKLWQYLPPALACAVANYLGNEGIVWAAVLILIALVAYVLLVLKVRIPGL